jgi:hypothetical protein
MQHGLGDRCLRIVCKDVVTEADDHSERDGSVDVDPCGSLLQDGTERTVFQNHQLLDNVSDQSGKCRPASFTACSCVDATAGCDASASCCAHQVLRACTCCCTGHKSPQNEGGLVPLTADAKIRTVDQDQAAQTPADHKCPWPMSQLGQSVPRCLCVLPHDVPESSLWSRSMPPSSRLPLLPSFKCYRLRVHSLALQTWAAQTSATCAAAAVAGAWNALCAPPAVQSQQHDAHPESPADTDHKASEDSVLPWPLFEADVLAVYLEQQQEQVSSLAMHNPRMQYTWDLGNLSLSY